MTNTSTFNMIRYNIMILKTLFSHLIMCHLSKNAYLVDMHDIMYDTPIMRTVGSSGEVYVPLNYCHCISELLTGLQSPNIR